MIINPVVKGGDSELTNASATSSNSTQTKVEFTVVAKPKVFSFRLGGETLTASGGRYYIVSGAYNASSSNFVSVYPGSSTTIATGSLNSSYMITVTMTNTKVTITTDTTYCFPSGKKYYMIYSY